MMRPIVLTFVCAVLPTLLAAEIRLPAIISDHMVLQQQADVRLWGEAAPDSKVQIIPSWGKTRQTVTSDAEGRWEATIRTPEAGGPYEIVLTDKDGSRTLHDVMSGEVWLCGGQSNMDISFRGLANQPVADAVDEILDSDYPQLRLFRVKRDYSLVPLQDCRGEWVVSAPQSAETFSAVGFLFGRMLHQRMKVPVGMITCAWGGSKVEAWMSRENLLRFAGVRIPDRVDPNRANVTPSVLYNAMLLPIAGYTIKGCLFYQGEANITNPEAYRERFPAMVTEWRQLWNADFPFFYVQLAPYGYTNMGWSPDDRQVARFREVQQACLADIPHSGLAATSDIGALHTIHPADKQTLAKRLFYLACTDCYGFRGFESRGPTYRTMKIQGDSIALMFDHAPYGISSGGKPIRGFEIAGVDRVFHPAEARIKGRSTVWVHSDAVPEPVAVRYCFTNYFHANLYNNYGLVAYPFRTDDWTE